MLDAVTKQPIRVIPNQVGSGLLKVPDTQRAEVEAVLDAGKARYWYLTTAYAPPGEVPLAWLIFSQNESLDRVQALLDEHQ